jgi:hypothetical protein
MNLGGEVGKMIFLGIRQSRSEVRRKNPVAAIFVIVEVGE